MKPFLFHHHTRDEITSYAKAGYAAVVPLAATEQHGPHLAVYTDSLICEHVSYEAAKKATSENGARLLLTPMLSIGCSDHHLAFGGTLSFSAETYLRMLKEIGESLIKDGFRKIIFLNAHGGNTHAMNQAAQDLAVKHPIWVASASYWNVAGEALSALRAGGWVPGHAGSFETSLVLALAGDLVRREKMAVSHPERAWIRGGPAGAFLGRHGQLTGADGFTDGATSASAEHGRKCLDAVVEAVARWLTDTCATMGAEEAEA